MTKPNQSIARSWYELMSSMRFAISLLTVLAIASIIGTVLKQNEPYTNYVFQFGQFWFGVFELLGLYDVYHTVWFIVILTFLVASTSLCIYRNTPNMLREMGNFKQHATETSLRLFHHHASWLHSGSTQDLVSKLSGYLDSRGYKFKTRAVEEGGDVLIAAKSGSYHRLGYILTHLAIVIICLGGLLDGNLPLKVQQLFGKKIETRGIPQSQVPLESRLGTGNLSFRGNITVSEKTQVDVVFLSVGEGFMVQDLPFTVALKKFNIEHYATGQPKSFASDLLLRDKQTGEVVEETIKVNHPLIYKGIAIYQASFGDGGTHLELEGWNLQKPRTPFPLKGSVNDTVPLVAGNNKYTIEFTDFRPLNVENFPAKKEGESGKSGMREQFVKSLGAATKSPGEKKFRNVGPSFQYKLRDAQGQAREFNNYMAPIELEGHWYLMSGVRENPNEPFSYLRFPLDEAGTLQIYMLLRGMLLDPAMHEQIAQRFSRGAMKGDAVSQTLQTKLTESAIRVLQIFAQNGYEGLADFLQKAVPADQQEKAAQIYLKILEGAVFEAYEMTREHAGLKPAVRNEEALQFVRHSMNSISDSMFYGSPVYLQLKSYDEIKASGLQISRSPGKNVVYTGSVMLIMGVFAMFFIRERRVWLLVKNNEVLFAMSGNRKTLDFEHEFAHHQQAIRNIVQG